MEASELSQSMAEQTVESTEALVLRAKRRDAEAFAELIRRYERMALSVAFSVLGNADGAGDVTQEAFLRAWQRLAELKEPARFGTWLCGIARNMAIDVQRRGKHVRASLDAGGINIVAAADERWSPDPLDELSRRERHTQLGKALQSLDEVTRSIVTLRYYDKRSSKEIGELLNLSSTAVDMRLTRARQQLKKMLGDAEVLT